MWKTCYTKETGTKRSKAFHQWQLCKMQQSRDIVSQKRGKKKRPNWLNRIKGNDVVTKIQLVRWNRSRISTLTFWMGLVGSKNDSEVKGGENSNARSNGDPHFWSQIDSTEFALERKKANFNRYRASL